MWWFYPAGQVNSSTVTLSLTLLKGRWGKERKRLIGCDKGSLNKGKRKREKQSKVIKKQREEKNIIFSTFHQ